MANKRVADILARTYFSTGEGKEVKHSGVSVGGMRTINLNLPLLVANAFLLVILLVGWRSGALFRGPVTPGLEAHSELMINSGSGPISIGFDFSDPKAGSVLTYYVNIKGADVSDYEALAFRARFSKGENHSIRIEFVNQFREVGEVGVPSLGTRWKDVVIPLKEVSGITSWSDVKQIGFVVDKWNASTPKGVLYVDNIRFVKGT